MNTGTRGIAGVMIVLMLAPTLVATPDAVRLEVEPRVTLNANPPPHSSIEVTSDDEFPAHPSVRRGDGTASNPYVISNWTILTSAETGISLSGTRAHVVVEDIYFSPYAAREAALQCMALQASCEPSAFRLFDVQNVTLRRVHVPAVPVSPDSATEGTVAPSAGFAVYVLNSSNVAVLDSVLGTATGEILGIGFAIDHSVNVRIENVTVSNSNTPLTVRATEGLVVRDSTFDRSRSELMFLEGPLNNTLFERNVFRHAHLKLVSGTASNLSLTDNAAFDGWRMFYASTPGTRVVDSSFCGNYAANLTDSAGGIYIIRSEKTLVNRNTFVNMTRAITFGASEDLTISENLVRGAPLFDWNVVLTTPADVHMNSFANLSRGVFFSQPANATGNWWGSADGPSRDGPGTGVPFENSSANVTIAPWLTSAPDIPTSCYGDNPARGANGGAAIVQTVSAGAGVHVHARVKAGPIHENEVHDEELDTGPIVLP